MHPTWGTRRVFEHFRGCEFFRFEGESTLPPQAGNASRWHATCKTLSQGKRMRKYVLTAIILTSLVLAGCDTNAGTVNVSVNETSAEITEVTQETIYMNNCGGKGDAKQTAKKSKSVNVEYAGSLGIDKVVINGEVSAKYGEINENTKEMELIAPAGTNMEIVIEWIEKTWLGFVTAQGKDEQANYKVSVPISVSLVSSRDLGCPSTGTQPEVSVPPTQVSNNSQQNQCQWLQSNFPQTADDAKTQYNLPSDTTFQFIYELCPSIANAFAFKANSTVEIQVPSGGCIDSWSGFTKYVGDVGTPVEDGHGGWRVYKGSVRAPEMTVRILGCK